jgi:hypothetical protein
MRVTGMALSDQVRSLDWQVREAEFICTAPEQVSKVWFHNAWVARMKEKTLMFSHLFGRKQTAGNEEIQILQNQNLDEFDEDESDPVDRVCSKCYTMYSCLRAGNQA